MATYYKGTLYLNSELNENTKKFCYSEYSSYYFENPYKKEYNRLSSRDRGELIDYLANCFYGEYREVNDKKVINILECVFNDIRFGFGSKHYFDIVFEMFVDVDGIVYGKELHTGLVFPLSQRNDFVKRTYEIKKIYGDKRYDYRIKISDTYEFPTLSLCEAVILENGVANQNEVLEYQSRFDEGFGRKKKRRDFEDKVRDWYNKNVYTGEIIPYIEEPKKKIERLSQSSETMVMDNIEYLLMQLSKVNNEMYHKYLKEYEELLNGLDNQSLLNVRPSTLIGFQTLEANIEIDLFSIKHNANGILEYLTTLQKEYLVNVLTGNDRETSITFLELEKINELFLKTKSRYGLLEQRNVLKKMAFLYLMEIKENIDCIDVKDLENSYFVDSIKAVLVHIDVMRQLGLIKSNVLVELNEDLSISNVLEIIKTLEFNKVSKEESFELVKKLEY